MDISLQLPAAAATEAEAGASSNTNSSKGQQPKPLRFVTNYGAPHPKRRRIGAACLTCRKRKTACSGECRGYMVAQVKEADD